MSNNRECLTDKIAFWLLCAIMFDCAALGGGTIVEIFGIDIRMVLFVLFFLVSLPAVIKNFKGLIANGYFLILLAWGVWLIISTVRGVMAGNSIDRIVSGWVGFASFVLLPGAICILTNKERILKLMKVMVAASFFLALQSVFVLLVYNLCDLDTFITVNLYIIQEELGGCTGVNDAVVRIFFRSHPLMVFGCVCSLYFGVVESERKRRLLYLGNIALCLFSLMISYTRSVYLCVFVSAAVAVIGLAVVVKKDTVKRFWKGVIGSIAAFLVLLLVCDVLAGAGYLSYGIYRTTGIDVLNRVEVSLGVPDGSLGGGYGLDLEAQETKESEEAQLGETEPEEEKPAETVDPAVDINAWSDNIRQLTVDELYQRIAEHPVIGSGMGAVLDVRAEMDGSNEYFYLDQAFKTGVVGVVLYVAPMILMVVLLLSSLHKMEQESVMICIVWLAGLLGIAAFAVFNPYLNGSNGIALYCCTIGVFSTLNKKQQIPLKK